MQRHFSFVSDKGRNNPGPHGRNCKCTESEFTRPHKTWIHICFVPLLSWFPCEGIRSERRRTRRGVRPHLRLATFPAEEPVHSLKNTGTTNKTFCRTKEKTHQSYNLSIGAMFFRVHVLRCMYAPPPPPRTWKTQMLRSDSSTNNAKPMKYIIWKQNGRTSISSAPAAVRDYF